MKKTSVRKLLPFVFWSTYVGLCLSAWPLPLWRFMCVLFSALFMVEAAKIALEEENKK